MQSGMKRVLVISYYWPPSGGSGVQRWVKMCKYLPKYGWTPVVYTPENPALTATDSTLSNDVSPELEVLRHPILEPGRLASGTTAAQVTPINGQKKNLKQRLMMWVRGNLFIPDPRVTWVGPSLRYLERYLKDHPVDAVVSTGPPHSMHLIARRLSRKYSLPWIADFRDPWTKMFYFKHLRLSALARKWHEALEQAVLDDASAVVAVSPLVQRDFRAMTRTRVELITNGFDRSDFEGRVEPFRNFTIVHAGLFAADGNPVEFWTALGALCKMLPALDKDLEIVLCGKTDAAVLQAIEAAGLASKLKNLGYVDHPAAVELMRKASMLLLPLRREPEYKATLPGKLFEYLASGRPILGIGQKDGAMASILSSTRSGVCFDWDEGQAMAEYVETSYRAFCKGELLANDANLEAYTREGLARSYAALLDELC